MDSNERKIVQELVTALGCVIPASDGYEPRTNLWNKYAAAKNMLAAAPQVVADERKGSPYPDYDRGFSNGWDACAKRAAAPVQAQEPVAVVYPPDGTVSPFTVINLGHGLVKMGDSLHDDRLPALWFGKDGLGMGVAEEMSRAAKEGETLAVVTFSNVEGLDVLAEVVQRIRSVAFPTAPVQPVAVPDGAALVNAMCKAGQLNDHGRRTLLNGEEIGFDLSSLMTIVSLAAPASQGDKK